jgi:fimbrial chaperone protein
MCSLSRAAMTMAVALLWPLQTLAASFDISPINIFFDGQKTTEKMTILNTGDGDLTLQLRLYRWTQDGEGLDVYEETKDLVAFPKIVTFKKGEDRIIRIGTQSKPADGEKTYRVYLEEVPSAEPARKGTSVRFLSRVGVPIFLKPHKIVTRGSIESVGMQKGRLSFKIKNEGNYHFVITGITVRGLDRAGKSVLEQELKGWYLLSGASRTYSAEIPREACSGLARLEVRSMTEMGALSGQMDVTREMCSQ